MYERFTDLARRVMQRATQAAQERFHDFIAPEHIIVGLMKNAAGVAHTVLQNLKINLLYSSDRLEALYPPNLFNPVPLL